MERDPELGYLRAFSGSQIELVAPSPPTAHGPEKSAPLKQSIRSLQVEELRYGSEPPHPEAANHDSEWERVLSQNLLAHFGNSIFQTLKPKDEGRGSNGLAISFAALQRMRIRKLQSDLAKSVVTMHFRMEEPAGWEKLLSEYITAVRDYDFIRSCTDRPDDPFAMISSRELEARILKLALESVPLEIRKEKKEWEQVVFADSKIRDSRSRTELSREQRLKALVERLAMAIVGGLLLIGPMWLMVLKTDRYTALISTSAFVLGFGLLMALFLTHKEAAVTVLSATAAYAAVLVVFVGTTTAPTSTTGAA